MTVRLRSRPLIIATLGVALLAGTSTTAAASTSADVNDFSYASWDADLRVGIDEHGRSTLHAVETLQAQFPEFDQNRGIVRGLLQHYQDASLDTEVLSVRDDTGAAVPFELEEDDDMLFVLIGDDEFQHGLTTYVIEYTMQDVVIAASETGIDEFYWDLLPLDSTQPIAAFHAEITFDETLSAALISDATACYQGPAGAADPCAGSGLRGPTVSGGEASFSVEAQNLPAGDGVTVAIGMDAGTVVQPGRRIPNLFLELAPVVVGGAGMLVAVVSRLMLGAFVRRSRRGTGLVIAQFDVPATLPPLVAAAVLPKPDNVIPAEIVHQAVSGMLIIHDADDRPVLRRLPGAVAPDPLDAEAHEKIFRGADAEGDVTIPEEDEAFGTRMRRLIARGEEEAETRGLMTKSRSRAAAAVLLLGLLLGGTGVAIGIAGLIFGRPIAAGAFVAALFAVILALIIGGPALTKGRVHTPEGALAYEYLLGVKEFIRVAEADRLQMLQSYSGAERRDDGTIDVIHVYERLLPYAMLFGLEKEWGRVLEVSYAETGETALWTTSPTTALAPALYTFAHTTTSSAAYQVTAASTSSSSFGGSSGGGFSGGGGGGGFSGGR